MDNQGATPLHWAAMWASGACTAALIERGANPKALDHNQDSPLHLAVRNESLESIKVRLWMIVNNTVVELMRKLHAHDANRDVTHSILSKDILNVSSKEYQIVSD